MKTALITGGSRGIGAACARELARQGCRVVINYVNSREKAEALAAELGGIAVQADVSDRAQAERMFQTVGDVDILVNNAGIARQELFTDISPETWRRIFAVNVDGAFNCCQLALPHMIHEKRGKIINISSMWGITGGSCETAYSASKAAIIGLTKALAKELGPSGIQVNCVAPGVIDTDMNNNLTAEDMEALRQETPAGRIGAPEDVAAAVAFLASAGGDFITGQVISVDGGMVI
jgi:3-oxoacyl-[acyl-carrier protein] reductase